MKYLSVTEIKELWNLPERTIRNYCQVGKIKGAKHEGKKWLIPENATKPVLGAVVKSTKKSVKKEVEVKEVKEKVAKPIKIDKQIKVENPLKEEPEVSDEKIEVVAPTEVIKYRLGKNATMMTYDTKKDERFSKDLLEVFKEEKAKNIKGEFYDLTRCYFVSSALKFDNIKISLEEIKCLMDLSPEYITNAVKVSDFVNTINLCFAFDNVYETLNTKFSKKMLLDWDKILRKSADIVETPEQIAARKKDKNNQALDKFIEKVNSKQKNNLTDIAKIHMSFLGLEYFGNTTEKLAKLLDLRLALKSGLKPSIICESLKHYYQRGIQEYKRQSMYLIDTYKTAQEKYTEFLQAEFSKKIK